MDGLPIPQLAEKLRVLLTGKIRLKGQEEERDLLADGSAWVHCPEETARRILEALGEEEFARIEASMHGNWGHVYRLSDIPNRHGHCNSNPNPALTKRFRGFSREGWALVFAAGASSSAGRVG